MKKLDILLILLIVSIPAFTQDKSILTESFSLVKYSENNYLNFFNLNIASSFNNLFQTEEECHSEQYLISQAPEFHQFPGRTRFLRVIAHGNREQNWGDMPNLIYGQELDIESEEKSESLAEGYLRRLAERFKKSRKTGSAVGLGVGGACLASGAALLFSAEEDEVKEIWGALLVSAGVVCAGGGALALAIPGRAEREFDNVLSISDPAQRERACHEALSSLAARGKKRRILSTILCAGYSAYFLVSKDRDYRWAGAMGAITVLVFTRKTPAERAFQNYLKESEQQRKLMQLIALSEKRKQKGGESSR